MLASVRETVYRRSLPLATRDLRIMMSTPCGRGRGWLGAAAMVIDELSVKRLGLWLEHGSPVGRPEIAAV